MDQNTGVKCSMQVMLNSSDKAGEAAESYLALKQPRTVIKRQQASNAHGDGGHVNYCD